MQGTGILDLILDCWWQEADTVGYWVHGFPKVELACQCARPGPSFSQDRVQSLLASGVCPLLGEAGLEAFAGFLVGGAGTCPLVGGAESRLSCGPSAACLLMGYTGSLPSRLA